MDAVKRAKRNEVTEKVAARIDDLLGDRSSHTTT
jgi:hypothetical protein